MDLWSKLRDAQQHASSNILMKMRTGSHLYGTNVATSDEDYVGVFSPHLDTVFGDRICEEVNLSTVSKNASGKNDSDAVDFKLYDLRKFLHLSSGGNPNIVETLFVNEQNLLMNTPIFEEIRKNRSLFVFSGMYDRFIGYAFSQKKKMIIKSENVDSFSRALDLLHKCSDVHVALETVEGFMSFATEETNGILTVGDIHLQLKNSVKIAKNILEKRLARASYRKDTILKHGYDLKFGMHLIRLLLEGIQLLKEGELVFPLKDRELLLSIRNGRMSLDEVLALATSLEDEGRRAREISQLPKTINSDDYRELHCKIVFQTIMNQL